MRIFKPRMPKEVRKRFRIAHPQRDALFGKRPVKDILRGLARLPKDATTVQIDKMLGLPDNGWSAYWCLECRTYQPTIVDFGWAVSNDGVCERCLRKGLKRLVKR